MPPVVAGSTPTPVGSGSSRVGTWAPVAVLGGLLVATLAVPGVAFDPPWLFAPLNFVFLTVIPVAAAVIAVAAYRRTGVAVVLAVGSAMVAIGLGAGIVPAALLYAAGPNETITIHNLSALIAAACSFVAAIGGVLRPSLGSHRIRHVVVAYGLVALAVAAILVLLSAGALPAFWADGPTSVRQTVLRLAIGLLGLSAFAWWQTAVRDREIRFLAWYTPGLALFALGLTGVLLQPVVGGPTSWVGRAAQYLGATYMLLALAVEARPGREDSGRPGLGVALLQTSLPFRPLVEPTSDAVVAVGQQRQVVYWNDAARRLFGYSHAEAFDRQPLELLLPPGASEVARRHLEALLASPRASVPGGRHRIELADRAGRPFVAELTIFASPDDDRLTVFVVSDISERVALQEHLEARVRDRTAELEAVNADLVRANNAKDEFLGLVSHELKTPVTTILAASALLRQRAGTSGAGLLDDLAAESARLASIIDNLLALARLEVGQRPGDRGDLEPVALEHVVATAAAAVRREYPGRRIEVRAEQGLVVEANEGQLVMVVRNYLTNGVKYSPADQPVEVELTRRGTEAEVTVRDRGIGLEGEDPEALFEPFHRSSRAGAAPGMGIGLTVCRRIVMSLGGTLGASPRADGPGSQFSFRLPLAPVEDGDADDELRLEEGARPDGSPA